MPLFLLIFRAFTFDTIAITHLPSYRCSTTFHRLVFDLPLHLASFHYSLHLLFVDSFFKVRVFSGIIDDCLCTYGMCELVPTFRMLHVTCLKIYRNPILPHCVRLFLCLDFKHPSESVDVRSLSLNHVMSCRFRVNHVSIF